MVGDDKDNDKPSWSTMTIGDQNDNDNEDGNEKVNDNENNKSLQLTIITGDHNDNDIDNKIDKPFWSTMMIGAMLLMGFFPGSIQL